MYESKAGNWTLDEFVGNFGKKTAMAAMGVTRQAVEAAVLSDREITFEIYGGMLYCTEIKTLKTSEVLNVPGMEDYYE